jgi:hypothetical protein
MCFVWISEQTAIISLYSIKWLVFVTEMECVYCVVRTGYLCVLCGSENKQRLFPCTALTDRFFVTEMESVYCVVRTESLYNSVCQCTFILSFLYFGAVHAKCQLLYAVAVTRCVLGEQWDLQLHRVKLFDITTR